MVKISVVNATWGERYHQFIPRFWGGVVSLERKPDEIVMVVGSADEEVIRASIPKDFQKITNIIVADLEHFNDYFDRAFTSATGDWLAWCSIDDWFFPEAFNEIDAAAADGCDLVCDTVVLHPSGKVFEGYWNPSDIYSRLIMPGAAPMTVKLYERLGGFDRDIYFSDWGFYIKAAAAGVKVHPTKIKRIMYDEGIDHETMSGPRKPPHVDQMAHEQIRQLGIRLRSEN
jgi:hypothetical protein